MNHITAQWLQEATLLLDILLRHPGSSIEQGVLIIVSLCVAVVVFSKTGSLLGIPRSGLGLSWFMMPLGLVLMACAMVCVMHFIQGASPWMVVAAAAGISLIVVIPLMIVIQKAGYIAGAMTWAISVGALAGSIMLISAAFDAVTSGGHNAEKSKQHKREIEQIMNRTNEQ